MATKQKTVIGIYRHDAAAKDGEGASRMVERVEIDIPVDEFTRKKGWKDRVREEAAKRGFNVLAVSAVHSGADLDVNITMTVDKKPTSFGQRRRAVTRGGRPVDGPIKTGKTMAAKRRAARETPER